MTAIRTVASPVPFGTPFSVTEEVAIAPSSKGGRDLSTISITTVPETSTWATMTLGFAGLGYAAFRRSAKGQSPSSRSDPSPISNVKKGRPWRADKMRSLTSDAH
jgi:hypothetical protein